jgi:hypothetical protein
VIEKILEGSTIDRVKALALHLFVEENIQGKACPRHLVSFTNHNFNSTKAILLDDRNIKSSLVALFVQLSAHTRQQQFSETSSHTYKAGKDSGVTGSFSFWHAGEERPLLSVVCDDVEKFRSYKHCLYSVRRLHKLYPRPALQKGLSTPPKTGGEELGTPPKGMKGCSKLQLYKEGILEQGDSVVQVVVSQFLSCFWIQVFA